MACDTLVSFDIPNGAKLTFFVQSDRYSCDSATEVDPMHIHTQLSYREHARAYKDMAQFIVENPAISVGLGLLSYLICKIPFELFALKMTAYIALISLVVCLVTTKFRTGSLSGVLSELSLQQSLFLPVLIGCFALSMVGMGVAGWITQALQQVSAASVPINNMQFGAMEAISVVLAGVLVFVTQIMPYVLAHFCKGLSLSRHQGEQIWYALLKHWKNGVSYTPIALISGMVFTSGIDASGYIVTLASLYSTFLLFIVFNVHKAEKQQSMNMAFTPT